MGQRSLTHGDELMLANLCPSLGQLLPSVEIGLGTSKYWGCEDGEAKQDMAKSVGFVEPLKLERCVGGIILWTLLGEKLC